MILTEFEIKRTIRKIIQGEIPHIRRLEQIQTDVVLFVFTERRSDTGYFTAVHVGVKRETADGIEIYRGEFEEWNYAINKKFRVGHSEERKFKFEKSYMVLEPNMRKNIYRIGSLIIR